MEGTKWNVRMFLSILDLVATEERVIIHLTQWFVMLKLIPVRVLSLCF